MSSTGEPSLNDSFKNNNLSLLNLHFLEKHFFKDAELLHEVLQHFKNSSQFAINEMRVNIRNNRKTELANATHKLRGAALNFMQNSITGHLTEIEHRARRDDYMTVTLEEIDQLESQILLATIQLAHLVHIWRE